MEEMNLQELAELLRDQLEGWSYYYQRNTGNIIELEESYIVIARERLEGEGGEEVLSPRKEQLVDLATDIVQFPKEYVMLPTKWQVNQYEVMKEFAQYIDDDGIQTALLEALESSNPEWDFKDEAMEFGVNEHWHDYFMERLMTIAGDWCDKNGIPVE